MARRRAETMARDAEALAMHVGGATYEQIRRHFGWRSVAAAHQAVHRGLDDVSRLPRAEAVKAEEERLDLLTRTFTRLLAPGAEPAVIIAAGLALLRVSESRRKLLGFDAPQRKIVEVVPEEVVDDRIARLESRKLELAAANGQRVNGQAAG